MDVTNLNTVELISFAFNLGYEKAEEAMARLFPKPGEHFVMEADCNLEKRLAAAVELDRRMAQHDLGRCSGPKDALKTIQRIIGPQEHESFWVIFLNAPHDVITANQMAIGTVSQCSVYPREIVKAALANNASSVILAHNHPSGNAVPSWADETLTKNIKAALALIDVRVLDHVIMTRNEMVSFAEKGLL